MKRVLGVAVALGLAGCYAEPATEQDVALTQQEVQANYLTIRGKRFMEAVTGNAVNATASIHVNWPTLNPPAGSGSGGGTCGATFISPHYAITAAHCVDRKGLDNAPLIQPMVDKIELRQYDTRNLNWFRALETGAVSGTWPNWSRGSTLTTNDGYVVTSDPNCVVKLRCGVAETNLCPPNAHGGDIALIYCPNRAANASFSIVSDAEAATGQQVEILWFHELLLLPTPPGSSTDQYWTHYGLLTSEAQNWHYRTLHQLLPFRSASGNNSVPYKVMAAPLPNDRETWTNAFGCHGTSGSGIFKAGTTLLLGPTVHGDAGFSRDGQALLCVDADHTSANQSVLSYTRQSMTRAIEQINIAGEGTIVLNDRP